MYRQPRSDITSSGSSAAALMEADGLERPDEAVVAARIRSALQSLCERLQEDQRASTMTAACRELSPVVGASGAWDGLDAIATAIERAVSAVDGRGSPVARRDGVEFRAPVPLLLQPRRPVPPSATLAVRPMRAGAPLAVRPMPAAAATRPLPTSDDLVLSQALTDMTVERVHEDYRRLGASFDRLIDLMPRDMDDRQLEWFIELADHFATPPARFDRDHAEMLVGGELMMRLFCDVVTTFNDDQRREAFESLAFRMPPGSCHKSHVSSFASALAAAEEVRDASENPRLDERQSRLDAWAAPLLEGAILKEEDLSDAMRDLGLDLDMIVRRHGSRMHPVLCNAAWLACMGIPFDPNDAHPLADIRKLERVQVR